MELLYFLKALYRRKWIIIGLTLIAIIAAFVFLINKKPYYFSIAQYSTGFTAEKVRLVDGTTAIDLFTADVKFDNVIETMRSPQVLNMISYRLLFHDISDPARAYKKLSLKDMQSSVYRDVNLDTAKKILTNKLYNHELLKSEIHNEKLLIEYLKLYNYNVESLIKDLTISRVQRTDYLDITFISENADLSAWVVNAVGNEFLNYYKNLNSKRTDENALNIKEMVNRQESRVDSLNKRLIDEKVNEGTIDPTARATGAMETVSGLETKLAEEKSKYNEHYNRISYLNKSLKTLQAKSLGSTSNDDVLRLTNRKNELVAALARKGGNDADMEKQINDLRNEISLKSGSSTSKSKLSDGIEDLNRQINEEEAMMNASNSTILDYTSQIRKYMGLTNINPGSSVKLDVIKTQLDAENKQLSSVKDKYVQAEGLSRDDPTSNFIQTRVGQAAAEPESKKTIVKMALSGISVFFLSAVFFIFLEIFDSSVKTPALFNKLSKVKITSVLNHVNLKTTSVVDVVLQENDSSKFRFKNIFKNNIRKLRYELLNSGKHVFLITSTQMQSGKTTVVEALASSLLLSQKKVLIIDLNFHNNSLTTIFGATKLIQDLSGKINYNLAVPVQKLTSETSLPGLHIIGCKQGNYTPEEALHNIDMAAFLKMLRAEYDYIIIEGASLNYFSDSKELSQYAEGIFTVFSADASLTQVDTESMRFLAELKDKNLGVILNKVLTENINS